jgi:hypothetical protein
MLGLPDIGKLGAQVGNSRLAMAVHPSRAGFAGHLRMTVML